VAEGKSKSAASKPTSLKCLNMMVSTHYRPASMTMNQSDPFLGIISNSTDPDDMKFIRHRLEAKYGRHICTRQPVVGCREGPPITHCRREIRNRHPIAPLCRPHLHPIQEERDCGQSQPHIANKMPLPKCTSTGHDFDLFTHGISSTEQNPSSESLGLLALSIIRNYK
jgi:hypothetical protein